MKRIIPWYKNLKINALLILLSISAVDINAQSDVNFNLSFSPSFNNLPITAKNNQFIYKNDTLTIDVLRFYISNLRIYNEGSLVYKEPNSYHLIDIQETGSLAISIDSILPSYDSLSFTLGTDSLTNVSGVMGGDLDPTKGMYWVWNSGYVNFKLEGNHSLSPTRNNRFEFHIGGYSPPHQTAQVIGFSLKPKPLHIIGIELSNFLNYVDLTTTNHVMSPGQKAHELSKTISKTIFIK